VSYSYSTATANGTYNIGALIGTNLNGSISYCYAKGNVNGGTSSGYSTGGLVGWNELATISNSYSTSTVTGMPPIGGLVGGVKNATVSNCYAVGAVSCSISGSSYVGGLAGRGYDSFTFTNCFYNKNIFTGTTSFGTGKTTDSLKMLGTFTNAGWSTSVWGISVSINNGYPYLVAVRDISLPVQATDFLAKADVESVTLSWKTQSEVDNAGFNILREDPNTTVGSTSPTTGFRLIASYTSNDSLKGMGTSPSGRCYNLTDLKVKSGATYQYTIQSVSTDGITKDLATLSVRVDVPKTYALLQNYPNPFNPTTTIGYQLPAVSRVTMKIYDILGREVVTLVDQQQNAGVYKIVFDGNRYSSGVYFYRVNAVRKDGKSFSAVKKLLLMK